MPSRRIRREPHASVDLDDAKVAELKEALVRAEARRIVATAAHVFAGEVETVTVRNQERAIDVDAST